MDGRIVSTSEEEPNEYVMDDFVVDCETDPEIDSDPRIISQVTEENIITQGKRERRQTKRYVDEEHLSLLLADVPPNEIEPLMDNMSDDDEGEASDFDFELSDDDDSDDDDDDDDDDSDALSYYTDDDDV